MPEKPKPSPYVPSLVGLADETAHEVPWRFPLRHGGTSTHVHVCTLAFR